MLVYIIIWHNPFFFFTFCHPLTFYAHLNNFASCKHKWLYLHYHAVVALRMAYTGLTGSAVDHSDDQSKKAHMRTWSSDLLGILNHVQYVGYKWSHILSGQLQMKSLF